MRKVVPGAKVSKENNGRRVTAGRDRRDGARQMLARALQAGFPAYVKPFADQLVRRQAADGPQRPPPGPRSPRPRRGAGAGAPGRRRARRRVPGKAALLLVDPARLVAQVPQWPRFFRCCACIAFQLGLRAGARAVPRHDARLSPPTITRLTTTGVLVERPEDQQRSTSRVTRPAMRPVGMSVSGNFRSGSAA